LTLHEALWQFVGTWNDNRTCWLPSQQCVQPPRFNFDIIVRIPNNDFIAVFAGVMFDSRNDGSKKWVRQVRNNYANNAVAPTA